ncbi:hypothetical protein [Kitasatospora mediocidica]|uniref:hypothetical protein n=1 Tax=Kitasatospora mediocidica TaxID=58352 RepID=UPI00056A43FB|nr:hypothetical protein [Kitasatospora mediocidica]
MSEPVQLPVPLKTGVTEIWESHPTNTPGLLADEVPEHHRKPGEEAHWRISHHSGLTFGAFYSKQGVFTCAEYVADMADWTRPAEDLAADPSLDLDELFTRVLQADGIPLYRHLPATES